MSNVVEAILTGPFKDENVLIPRIHMIPTDMPFQFNRLHFPIRLDVCNLRQQNSGTIFRIMWFRSREGLLLT